MNDKSSEFIQRLTSAQDVSPALRASYQAEMDAMLEPKLTARPALIGIAMVVALVVCAVLIVRNMFIYKVSALILASWATLAVAFSAAAYLIVRDLWRGKHSPKAAFSIAHILNFAAGAITVAALLMGLSKPSDPASMFNAFFMFVFYFACSEWAVHNRIAAAELAAREQMLRIECRLADLSERFSKG
jgi:cation transport ATPase